MAGLRADLGVADAPALERLLVERVVLSWLAGTVAETVRARAIAAGGKTPAGAKLTELRVDRAHARLVSSARALATVRKLLKPARSPSKCWRPWKRWRRRPAMIAGPSRMSALAGGVN